jgi:hypothetical protein
MQCSVRAGQQQDRQHEVSKFFHGVFTFRLELRFHMETKTLFSFWGARDIIVLVATMVSGIAVCLTGRRLRPVMTVLPIFGLYAALLNAVLLIVAFRPVPNHSYFLAYWYGNAGENLLSCLLAVEISSVLLESRKQFMLAWSGGLALLLVLSIGSTLPARSEQALLSASLAADFICGLVLIALLYFETINPPHQVRWIIAGVLVPAGINAACAIQWLKSSLSPAIQAALPIGSLAGLLLFLAGVYKCHLQSSDQKNQRLTADSGEQITSVTCSASGLNSLFRLKSHVSHGRSNSQTT